MPRRPLPVQHQSGVTLIELLVGVALSMVGVLAGLVLFQNLLRLSVDGQNDARHDGQLATALLQLQLEAQSAGYGIENAGLSHIVAPDERTLYWRYQEPTGTECRGFRAATNGDDLVMQLLRADCTLAQSLENLNWQVLEPLARFTQAPPEFTLTLQTAECFPYGQGQSGSHYMLSVSAESSVRRNARLEVAGTESLSVGLNNYNFCLPNINQGGV